MTVLFCVRPAMPNVGNGLIFQATTDLLLKAFGTDASVVSIAAQGPGGRVGFTAAQVYDMNRLADGVVLGGGNLFENGQLAIDPVALDALDVPLLILGVSHGRIQARDGHWSARTDSLASDSIRQLQRKALATLVRDDSSRILLEALGITDVQVGGCPTLALPPRREGEAGDGRVLLSLRHPARMSIPPDQQWSLAGKVEVLIDALRRRFGDRIHLVCHDYQDLEFGRAFPGVPLLHFDDPHRYAAALRRCQLSVTFRLHAFLPCLAFGTPSVHIAYDERGHAMVRAAGMAEWDVDLLRTPDLAGAVMTRIDDLGRYDQMRLETATLRQGLLDRTNDAIGRFERVVRAKRAPSAGAAA